MKKIALAAALSVAATSAFAGGATEAMPEEVKGASSSAGGYVVPLLLLVALAVAAANQ
jgi:hypothetical protein